MKVDVFVKAVPAKNANEAYVTARAAIRAQFTNEPEFRNIKVNLVHSDDPTIKPDSEGRLLYNVHVTATVL